MNASRNRPAGGRAAAQAAPASPLLLPEAPALRRASCAAAGTVIVVMVFAVAWMSGKDVFWPEDSFSDVNTLMAAEAFDVNGFARLRFLPVHYVPSVGERPTYYTHYPPLPDVVVGLVRRLGGTSLAAQRTVCGLLGIAGWALLAWAVSRRLGTLAGALGLLFVATSGFFLSYGVSVHQHGFNALFVGAFLACFLLATEEEPPSPAAAAPNERAAKGPPKKPAQAGSAAEETGASARPGSRRWLWGLAWAALFLESWTSFEFIVFTQVVVWGYVLIAGEWRRRWRALLLLATAPVAGVALHFAQNIWALGWAGASADFLGYGQYGGETRWKALAKMPQTVRANILRCFGWSWYLPILAAGACVLADVLQRQPWSAVRRRAALLAGLAAAPLAWYVGMASHAHHPHTAGQMMPIAVAAFGGAAALAGRRLFARGTPALARAVLAGGAVVLVVMAVGQYSAAKARLEKPASGGGGFVAIARALGPHAFGDKEGVLFNMVPEAQLGYCLRHSAQLCQARPTGPDSFEFTRPDWLRGRPFPQDLGLLRDTIGKDWSYRYYLFYKLRGDQEELYGFLKRTCRGEVLVWEAAPGQYVPLQDPILQRIVRFDISPLFEPPDSRPPLPADLRDRQQRDDFDPWIIPGFRDRLTAILQGEPPPSP